MRIAIVGSFSTGKTTLVEQLQQTLPTSIVLPEEARRLLGHFTVDELSQPAFRTYLLMRQLVVERLVGTDEELVLIDAGIINVLAYDLEFLQSVADSLRLVESFPPPPYDLVLDCDTVGVRVVDDGQRLLEAQLRLRIRDNVHFICEALGYRTFKLTGDQEHRLANAEAAIKRAAVVN